MVGKITANAFFLAGASCVAINNITEAQASVKIACPFPVSEVVMLQMIPDHYPASLMPDIEPQENDNSTGRIEWNNFYATQQSGVPAPSVVAECTPQRTESRKRPASVRINIPRNATKCIMDDVRKPATRFWCE